MLHEPTLQLQNQVKRSLRTNMQCFNQIHQCPSSAPFQGSITCNQKWNPRQKNKNIKKLSEIREASHLGSKNPQIFLVHSRSCKSSTKFETWENRVPQEQRKTKKKQRDAANSTSHVLKVCLICKIIDVLRSILRKQGRS